MNRTKSRINRESVRVLAQAIGARAAARSLGINEKTVLSWSHRGKWKLPLRRNVGRPALRSQISPSDALAEFKRQGGANTHGYGEGYSRSG